MQKTEDDEINLLDYLIVLAKHKKLIIYTTLVLMVITAIYSLILSPVYKAETKILPPQQSSSGMASQLLSQLGGAAGFVSGVMPFRTPSDLYVGLIKSNTVLDRMIDRFSLMSLYKIKFREVARQSLSNRLKVTDEKKSGIITIGVEDKNPKRAADMANAFVEELRRLTRGLAVSEASQRRLFFEEQLEDVKKGLAKSEEAMRGFQEKTGVLKIEEQAKAVIEGMAHLRAQIAAKEVELRVMRTYSTENNPDVKKTEAAINGMRAELAKLEKRKGDGYDPLMPTGRMPEVGTEYVRRLRDLKFNETLYELLLKQYEAAKLDEAKDATIIQVIDKAEPPEQRIKPKRRQMVMIAGFVGLFLSIFAAFFLEYIEKSSLNQENRQRLNTLKGYINVKREDLTLQRLIRRRNKGQDS
ncbi:MAG: Tyrosine-protein kinase wzc [Syntrophorhabdus sp. PtaU1.Bin058]|nr:MAG: Tyrosine-protein kinase wzc [Syntrophorhabdus sp. PtaU1.Bin058]